MAAATVDFDPLKLSPDEEKRIQDLIAAASERYTEAGLAQLKNTGGVPLTLPDALCMRLPPMPKPQPWWHLSTTSITTHIRCDPARFEAWPDFHVLVDRYDFKLQGPVPPPQLITSAQPSEEADVQMYIKTNVCTPLSCWGHFGDWGRTRQAGSFLGDCDMGSWVPLTGSQASQAKGLATESIPSSALDTVATSQATPRKQLAASNVFAPLSPSASRVLERTVGEAQEQPVQIHLLLEIKTPWLLLKNLIPFVHSWEDWRHLFSSWCVHADILKVMAEYCFAAPDLPPMPSPPLEPHDASFWSFESFMEDTAHVLNAARLQNPVWLHALGQVYGYAVANRLRNFAFSCYSFTYCCYRDQEGVCYVSDGIRENSGRLLRSLAYMHCTQQSMAGPRRADNTPEDDDEDDEAHAKRHAARNRRPGAKASQKPVAPQVKGKTRVVSHTSTLESHLPLVPWRSVSLLCRIGTGRSGSVYAAKWSGRVVAVKMFDASKKYRLLKQELAIYEHLRSQGQHECTVAQLFLTTDPSGILYGIGLELGTELELSRDLPQQDKAQIITALQRFHSTGCVHRDLYLGRNFLRVGQRIVLSDLEGAIVSLDDEETDEELEDEMGQEMNDVLLILGCVEEYDEDSPRS